MIPPISFNIFLRYQGVVFSYPALSFQEFSAYPLSTNYSLNHSERAVEVEVFLKIRLNLLFPDAVDQMLLLLLLLLPSLFWLATLMCFLHDGYPIFFWFSTVLNAIGNFLVGDGGRRRGPERTCSVDGPSPHITCAATAIADGSVDVGFGRRHG